MPRTACPLRFMKVCGLAMITFVPAIDPRAISALACFVEKRSRCCSATSSTTMKPALCLVVAYLEPGLPSPTIKYGVSLTGGFCITASNYTGPWLALSIFRRRTTDDRRPTTDDRRRRETRNAKRETNKNLCALCAFVVQPSVVRRPSSVVALVQYCQETNYA